MKPPLFQVCNADPFCQALLGNPVRVYGHGEAPQSETRPYAVWQIAGGQPENYMDRAPDIDGFLVQIDVYAVDAGAVKDAAEAIRDAIQMLCHIVAYNFGDRDTETRLYRYSFDAYWFVHRL